MQNTILVTQTAAAHTSRGGLCSVCYFIRILIGIFRLSLGYFAIGLYLPFFLLFSKQIVQLCFLEQEHNGHNSKRTKHEVEDIVHDAGAEREPVHDKQTGI